MPQTHLAFATNFADISANIDRVEPVRNMDKMKLLIIPSCPADGVQFKTLEVK